MAAHIESINQKRRSRKADDSEVLGSNAHLPNVTRLHTVPSTVKPPMQERILSELRGGRSLPQVCKVYNVTLAVATDIWMRDQEKWTRREIERQCAARDRQRAA